jgi:hypothetical protein
VKEAEPQAMINIIPLDMGPASFGSQRWDDEMPNMKYPNSVLFAQRYRKSDSTSQNARADRQCLAQWPRSKKDRRRIDSKGVTA